MRKSLLLLTLLLAALRLSAQDTVFLKNKQFLICHVISTGEEITYKRADIPDGPDYSIKKSNVKSIHYENGKIEQFEAPVEERQIITQLKSPGTTAPDPTNNRPLGSGSAQIEIERGRLFYDGRYLSERALIRLAERVQGSPAMKRELKTYNNYRIAQYCSFGGGLAVGIISAPVMLAGLIGDQNGNPNVSMVLGGFALFVSGVGLEATAITFKILRKTRLQKIARAYNDAL